MEYTITWAPALIPAPTPGQSWALDAWDVAGIAPCAACGGRLLWAEAGYVPGYRLCERCGRPWLAEPQGEGRLRVRIPETPDGPAWSPSECCEHESGDYADYIALVSRFGGKLSEESDWRRLRKLTWAPRPASAPPEDDLEDVTLRRSGLPPLLFRGVLLAESDGERQGGREQNRWHELAVYRTRSGRYALRVAYRTRWQGELDRDLADAYDSPADVAEALRDYDPTEPVAGYPEGEQYAAKQARLLADVRRRYEEQVSDILGAEEFAEDVG